MDEDLVLVDNCHTEIADPSSMSNSPIRMKRIEISIPTEPREPLGRGVPTDDPRTHSFDYTIDEKEDEPSSSKDFDCTQENKASDQYTCGCVKKTKKSSLGTNSRPGLAHRRKPIQTERRDDERPGIEETHCKSTNSISPTLDSPPPPSSPSFSPPPPPPPLSYQPFMDFHCNYVPAPPPPPLLPLPPPPPPPPPSYAWPQCPPGFEVRTAEQLIPVRSEAMFAYSTTSPIVGIVPFHRKVLLVRHQAHAADYQEHEWLLRFADTGVWYEKPNRTLVNIGHHERTPNKLMPMTQPKPVCLELPKVWASAALTTSLDNATSVVDQRRSKALKSRPLVYCLVLSTYETIVNMGQEKIYGSQMYKLVRCGSREAAATEAFYAAGVHGYNVAFACVMRLDEDFAGSFGRARKVEQLSDLALENHSREDVRVFY